MSGKDKRFGRSSSMESKATRRQRRQSCLTEALEPRRLFSTVVWTGSGDGSSWTDPNNWSTHALPGSADDALVNTSGGAITLNGTVTVRSLNTARAITVAGGTLSLQGGTGAPISAVSGGFNIASGAVLNVASGVKVELLSANNTFEALTVNGTMNMAGGSSVVLDTTASYANTQVAVNGTLNMTGASITYNYNQNTDGVYVNPGGHLVAASSTFSLGYVTLAVGSVFNAGDLSGDSFNTTLSVPAADVALLSTSTSGGGWTDNVRFNDIDLTTDLPTGTTNLNKIGSSASTSTRFVLPASTNVSSGSTLNLGSGASIFVVSAYNVYRALIVNGTMTMASGSSVVLDTTAGYANTQVAVNGTLNMTGASITYNYNQNTDGVYVNPGGHLVVANSTFTCGYFAAANGSSISFSASQAGQTFYFGKGGSGLTLASPDLITVQNGATVVIPESLQIGTSAIVSVSPSSSLIVNGNVLGSVQSPVAYNPLGTVTLNGSGTAASPELLEAMSANLSSGSLAFVNNFAYGTLALAGTTYVKLVDQSQNTTSTSPEAVYVNSLIVPAGTTLNLNGFQLYARYAQVAGTIVLGTGGVFTQIPASSGTLALDYPIPGNLSQGALSTWSFYGTAGQVISAVVDPGSGLPGGPISPTLQWAQVQLVMNSSNAVLATGSDATAGGVVALTNVQLPSTGWYHVAIQAPSSHASSAGNYVVAAYDVTPDVQSLNVGQPTVGSVATPYSYNPYTFAAAAGTQVQFVLQGESASGLTFTLTGPNGFTGFSNIIGSSALITLPTTGSYTLTAQGNGGAIGQYAFEVVQTSLTPLVFGTPLAGTFAGTGQAQLFEANVQTAGQALQFILNDLASTDHNELYLKLGSPPTRESFDYEAAGAGADQSILVQTAGIGIWYALVYAETSTSGNTFSVTANLSPVFVTGVTPNHAGTGGQDTVGITGAGFDVTSTVRFNGSQGESYTPILTNVVSDADIQLALNLPTWTPDVYSIFVTTDGVTAQLPTSFQVTPGGSPNLQVQLILPSALGRHASGTILVQYSNTGTVAIPDPIIEVDGSLNALLTLDPAFNGGGLATPTYPDGISSRVQFLAVGSNATPEVIQPGESFTVPIYYRGLLQPWNFTYNTVHFNLTLITNQDQTPINYTTLEQQDSLTELLPADQTAFWNALQGMTGSTWGSFDAKIASQATSSTPYELNDIFSGLIVAATYQISGDTPSTPSPVLPPVPPSDPDIVFGPLATGTIDQYPSASSARTKTVFVIKGFNDGAADNADAETAAQDFPGAEVIAVDWEAAANPFDLFPENYPLAALNTYVVGDEIAAWMLLNGVNPATTVFFGHSLGAQISGEVGKDVQTLFGGIKLQAIYAADAAGPLFELLPPLYRLDPTDATWVEDIHTTLLLGDPLLIATKDIYVIGASWNPKTAHTQAWDLLVQSLTDTSMTTVFGDGMGIYSHNSGIDFYIIGGGTTRQTQQDDPIDPFVPDGEPDNGGDSHEVTSFDPNDLLGADGYGPQNMVRGQQLLPYRIDFENATTATAPAQVVTITEQLSTSLNWQSFQLTEIGFGNNVLTIPSGVQQYQTIVPIVYNGVTIDVLIQAGLHGSTGEVYASFQSVDPGTMLPPSVLIGFLPPEDGSGRGIGHVSFTILAKAGLPTGTQIRSTAVITFDDNASITTDQVSDTDPSLGTDPTKEALVTLDTGLPTSTVASLPPTESKGNFNVSWGGMDDTGGSGIATYKIYVSANGTPFVPWLLNTNATTGTFAGTPGYTYSFYSVATDNVGNVQPTPTGGQATTMVSGTAPQTLTLTGSAEYLQLDADGTHLDVWNSTSPTGSPTQYLLSSFSSIIVSGAATGTSLTIDFTNGDPLVASGLTFAGVAGKTNTLNVIGTSGNDNVAVNGTSVIEADAFGSASILYSNLSAITFNGGFGNDSLTQTAQPGAPVSFLGTTFSDSLSVNAGTFTFPASSASTGIAQIDLGTLSIGAAAKVVVAPSVSHANRSVLILNSLSLAGNAGSWTGTLNLADNDLILKGGTLATVISQIQGGLGSGNWKGAGVTSSNAANDSTHLTALGVLLNTNGVGGPLYGGGTTSGLFDGVNPAATAILVKYTYYGDTNLDGAVDGSDYSRIDSGFLNHLTGWYNGDLNYSGAVDGTDYTLIDNTFNSQGSRLSNLTPTLTLPAAPSLTYDGTSDVTNWVIATLSGPAGDPTPTGTVTIQYFNGSSGTGAALPSAPITPGTYTVVASYAGDTHYAAELSNAVTFIINKAQATVALAAGPGTIKYDGTTDVTNWVKGFATGLAGAALATGTVTPVYYGGTSATGTPLSSSPVNAGTYTVVGSYSGDSNYAASLSAPITFTISATSGAVPLTLTGAALYLRLDADGQHTDVWNSTNDIGSPVQSVLLSTISSIAIAGVSAGTTLSVDFAAGDPLVPSGLNFNGFAGANNILKVIDSGDASASSFTVDTGNVMVAVPSGTAPIGYANTKLISVYAGTGSETLTQNAQPGNGATSLSYLNTTASDNLVLNTGTFTFAGSVAGAGITSITLGDVSIKSGTTLTVAAPDVHADRYVMTFGSLFIAGSTSAWLGQLNLTGNDLIVHNGSLSQLTNQVASGYANGNWTGQGITSSTAATASGHQTALGIEANNNGSGQPLFGNGAPLGLFDGQNPSITDVLIKYTYYGDANLDGKVDGSDYARIDSGILNHATGWSNGDFNYDAVINGSDYTLIDNYFNSQGANLAASVAAAPTAMIETNVATKKVGVANRSEPLSSSVLISPRLFSQAALIPLEHMLRDKSDLILRPNILDRLEV